MSTISASTTSTTAFKITTDTTGALVFQTGASPTTAMTLGSDQSVTFAGTPTYSGGTANGVAYLNGSKVLTTGTALVFDGSNLGVGVTPSAWKSNYKAQQTGNAAAIVGRTDNNNNYFSSNWYVNSSNQDIYQNTGYATLYSQGTGTHAWYTAASGTAGAAITFTQAMTLDASGNLGIGTTNPNARLHLNTSSSSIFLTLQCSGGYGYVVNDGTYVSLASDIGSTGIKFRVARAAPDNAATIDSSGNMTITGTVKPSALLSFNGNTVETNPNNAFPTSTSSLSYTLAYGPSSNDGHILGMSWTNVSQYGAQLWFDTDPSYEAAFRQRSGGGVWNSWSYLYHSNNYKVYTAVTYVSATSSGTRASVTISLNSNTNKILIMASDLLRCSSGVVYGVSYIDSTVVDGEFMYQQANGNLWQTTTGTSWYSNAAAGTHTVSVYAQFGSGAGAFDGPFWLQVLVWDGI